MALTLLQNPEALEARLRQIPQEAGVYFLKDDRQDILYIGKAKKLRIRVRSYFRPSQPHSPRITMMVQQVAAIEFIVTDTEAEALALEANLIKQHQPHFNILLKDDKKYPYVCITWSEPYPRLFITRKRRLNNSQDRYYGPYVDGFSLRQTLLLVKKIFPLRQRPQPLFKNRPCLNYDLGRCPGVCQELISPEEYHQTLLKVAMVFQGRTQELQEILTQGMEAAAANLDFEKAARFRDQLQALASLHQHQKVALADETVSQDVVALARHQSYCAVQLFQIRGGRLVGRLGFFAEALGANPGEILQEVLEQYYQQVEDLALPQEIIVQTELPQGDWFRGELQKRRGRKVSLTVPQRQGKLELVAMVERNARHELEQRQRLAERTNLDLQDLAAILGLATPPRRIEGYDISHIQGSHTVASQVVFVEGVPAKHHYRHYKIKNPEVRPGHSDDFASLAEVIGRRFRPRGKALAGQDLPDLVMIDGGKGQLSAVVQVLEKLGLLGAFTLVSLAKQREEIFLPEASQPLVTTPEQPGVQLLRRVRDEAHRFALSFHRQKRLHQSYRSELGEIPGLGFQRQKQLLAHFHSLDSIRRASLAQLRQVPGIGDRLAQEIYQYFNS